MTDLHDRFRSLDRVGAPDLWSEVTQRATAAHPPTAWRFPPMNRFASIALAVTAIALAAIAVNFIVRSPSVGPPPIPTNSPTPVAVSGCIPAPAALASLIATRLTATPDVGMPVRGGVSLGNAYIVESADSYPVEGGEPERMYFVGARIEGRGLENIGAVWVTDDPTGGGSIFAVSTRARQFSNWPERAGLEPSANGYAKADRCAHVPVP